MERDDARKILKRWAIIEDEIRDAEKAYKKKCDEIDIIAAIPSTTQSISGMPHQKMINKSTERVAIRRIELAESCREELEELNGRVIHAMHFRSKVENILLLCTANEEKVVRCRYKENKTMRETASEMLITERAAWRYEKKVLDTICEQWI